MSHNHQATPSQLMSVIQTQTAIAKLGLDLNAVMTLVAEQAQQITNAKEQIDWNLAKARAATASKNPRVKTPVLPVIKSIAAVPNCWNRPLVYI